MSMWSSVTLHEQGRYMGTLRTALKVTVELVDHTYDGRPTTRPSGVDRNALTALL